MCGVRLKSRATRQMYSYIWMIGSKEHQDLSVNPCNHADEMRQSGIFLIMLVGGNGIQRARYQKAQEVPHEHVIRDETITIEHSVAATFGKRMVSATVIGSSRSEGLLMVARKGMGKLDWEFYSATFDCRGMGGMGGFGGMEGFGGVFRVGDSSAGNRAEVYFVGARSTRGRIAWRRRWLGRNHWLCPAD